MYEKQGFKTGDVLKADALNAMDEQISQNAERLENLKDGIDGGYYIPSLDEDGNLTFTPSKEDMPNVDGKNIKGTPGKDGTSVAITNIIESTESGGSNVATFSDGKTLTVKNGTDGKDGKTPVKGTDYWTETDKNEIVNTVLSQIPDGNEVAY